MGTRWGPDGPPPEAYSRVSDPDRYLPVGAAALALLDELRRTYDATAEPFTLDDWPDAQPCVRLTPRTGAPLTIGVRPGGHVVARRGHWDATREPGCGCDACDDDAEECIAELRTFVRDTVEGTFEEELRPDALEVRTPGERRGSGLFGSQFAQLAKRARPGRHTWAPWPRRVPDGTDSLSP